MAVCVACSHEVPDETVQAISATEALQFPRFRKGDAVCQMCWHLQMWPHLEEPKSTLDWDW